MIKKVIIAGDRDFTDKCFVFCEIERFYPEQFIIVSGRARGVDSIGEAYADSKQYNKVLFPANWEGQGKRAGPIRNRMMADYADELLAFLKEGSRGTADMIKAMGAVHKKVTIVKI